MDLLRLEQQRQALEQSLQQLRTSLKIWQTWEAEYEGLKEETQAEVGALDSSNLAKISKEFNGELVTEREIRDIAGLDKESPRTGPQISDIISRRQEYVQKNIEAIQRQYWDAEAKLEELDFVTISAQRAANDALPLTEIHEELDDDDNIVSSSLSQPEMQTNKLVDTLRKAGLSDADLSTTPDHSTPDTALALERSTSPSANHSANEREIAEATVNDDEALAEHSGSERPAIRKKSVSFTADTKRPPEPVRLESEEGKKSVSFAEKVAVAPAALPPDNRSVSFAASVQEIPSEPASEPTPDAKTKTDVQKDLRKLFKPGDKVAQLNDDDEIAALHIVLPENESEEDARTRSEMLNYHLNEVGNIVAQIDLDEAEMDADDATSASDFTSSEHPDEDTPYTSGTSDSEDEDEDEFGRSRKRGISDEYRKEMQELERRLIGNLGPAPSAQTLDTIDPELDPQDVRRLVIREKRSSVSSMSSDGDKKPNAKKRVSFAEALDVADTELPPTKAPKVGQAENVAPVAANVLERHTSEPGSGQIGTIPAGQDTLSDDNASLGPPGKIIADKLVERTPVESLEAARSPGASDSLMERRELAAEYYRRRNDFIRQHGGFNDATNNEQEEEQGDLMEERDGKLKKVSRFKAARIRP